jgi:uncharacterized protein (TIGR02147 family)
MPSIYSYLDYRQYLKDDFAARQARNHRYSYRAAAVRLGINSGTLVRILAGKRNISRSLLPTFVKYLGLKSKEETYFGLLVRFNQTKDSRERRELYGDLVRHRGERKRNIEPDRYEYFHEWYYCAVRELLRFYPFEGDWKALAEMVAPNITPYQAERAVEVLRTLGLVQGEDRGALRVVDSLVTTGDRWSGTAIHRFQIAMMHKALEAIDRFPKEQRDISTLTVGLSAKGLDRAREVLKRARDEILDIEESDASERVYQLNMQVFPLTEQYQGGDQ